MNDYGLYKINAKYMVSENINSNKGQNTNDPKLFILLA